MILSYIFSFLPIVLLFHKEYRHTLRIRIFRTIHYVGMAVGGLFVAANVNGESVFSLWRYILPLVALAVYVFQGAVLLNDYFDYDGDRLSLNKTPLIKGFIKRRHALYSGWFLSLYSIFLGFLISYVAGISMILAVGINILYSMPPFRLKRFYPISTFLLALGGFVMMLSGFSAIIDNALAFPLRMFLLIIITFTLTFGTKDIKDIEGDRVMGVKNLYIWFDIRTASLINSFLVFIAYLLPPFLLACRELFFFSIPAGLLSAYFILFLKKEKPVFITYILFGFVVILFIVFNKISFN